MKRKMRIIPLMLLLSGCSGWTIQPLPNPPTPFLPPTLTPSVFTPTPVVIGPSPTIALATSTTLPSATTPPTSTTGPVTETPSVTSTALPGQPAVGVEVLGCNTSIDVTHGMGEVTNAYITIKNTGRIDLVNLTTTLFALDEGREHPDKTVETAFLQAGYQVTLKLTVDSTYRAETPIQVEVRSQGGLFERVGSASCRDLGIFAPQPASLNTPIPPP